MSIAYRPADDGPALAEAVLGDVLRRAARQGPSDVLLTAVTGHGRWTWTAAELVSDAEAVAAALLRRHPPGSHIATFLGNGPEAVLLQFGVALAGMVLVPVNPKSRPNELEHALALAHPVCLYVPATASAMANEVAGRLPHEVEVVALDGDWRALRDPAAPDQRPPLPDVAPESLAQIQFTSGTSGPAKGVRIHHRGMVVTAYAFARRIGLPDGGVWVNPMPLFHTAGNVLGTLGALWQRAEHVVLPFEPASVLRVTAERGATLLSAAPTLLHLLMAHGDFAETDLGSLRVVFTGGMTLTPSTVDTIERRFGAPLSVTFGMTETCGCAVLTAPLSDPADARRTTAGLPIEGTDVRVVAPDGTTVATGETGELQLRGERLTRGYYDDPAATARAIDADGWLGTGDLAAMDDRGYLRIVGRLKDMIKTGGENVSPDEVEEVVAGHPLVARAAVVGLPDERWGELVVGFVVAASGAADELGEALTELTDYCRARLTPFKVPRRWHVVQELPMTASGKIQRATLRETAEHHS